jgi:uncharacterized protein
MVIGVISDTHGLMRKEVLPIFRGCDLIVHAGDIGSDEIIEILEEIAPVRAVAGNTDFGAWAGPLPQTEVVEAGDALLYLLHDIGRLDLDPVAAGFHCVIFGHSHKPEVLNRNGLLYINPGSAGPRRFRLPVSVARLRVRGTSLHPEIIEIPV